MFEDDLIQQCAPNTTMLSKHVEFRYLLRIKKKKEKKIIGILNGLSLFLNRLKNPDVIEIII